MATWHQAKNQLALALLWAPDPVRWKCVHDRYNQPASAIKFDTEQEARAYAARTGDVVIAPRPQPTRRSA